MTENAINLKNTVEAIIFASGEPIERIRLVESLGCSPERLDNILKEIALEYDERGSAVQLLSLGAVVQFVTRPEYAAAVRNVLDMKRNQPLSNAAFEVLAIVAYNQPVTKAFIEQVRGVDCSYSITSLVEKGLIKESGRLDVPGKPILYRTTKDFLRVFGLETLNDLPDLPEFSDTEDGQVSFNDIPEEEIAAAEASIDAE